MVSNDVFAAMWLSNTGHATERIGVVFEYFSTFNSMYHFCLLRRCCFLFGFYRDIMEYALLLTTSSAGGC